MDLRHATRPCQANRRIKLVEAEARKQADRKEDLTSCFGSELCSGVEALCQTTTLSIGEQTCKLTAQLASRCKWQRILAAYLAQKYHKLTSMRMTSLCQCRVFRTMPPSRAKLTTCRSNRIPTSQRSSRSRSRTASETRTSSARQRGCIHRVAAVVAIKGWQRNRHPLRLANSSGRTRRQLGKRRGLPLR